MKLDFIWYAICDSEDIYHNTYMETFRVKVIGGWIVRHQMLIDAERDKEHDGWTNCHNSMVFVPDPNHEWEVV